MRMFGGWLDATDRLQREKYNNDLRGLTGDEYREAVRTYVTAIVAELGEYLADTDWKPWKKGAKSPSAKRVEELVDVAHFLANLFVLEGVDDVRLSEAYLKKVQFNRERPDHEAERSEITVA